MQSNAMVYTIQCNRLYHWVWIEERLVEVFLDRGLSAPTEKVKTPADSTEKEKGRRPKKGKPHLSKEATHSPPHHFQLLTDGPSFKWPDILSHIGGHLVFLAVLPTHTCFKADVFLSKLKWFVDMPLTTSFRLDLYVNCLLSRLKEEEKTYFVSSYF